MKVVLLISVIAIISFIYILLTLNKALSLTKSVMTPKQYLTTNTNYKGYIVVFDKNMFIHDFDFYKSIFNFLSKNLSCKMIALDLSVHNLDNGDLLQKLNIKNIPAIYYIDEKGNSTEVINFINIEENLSIKQILDLIKQRLEKIQVRKYEDDIN
ncbi:hypothetical protein [Priestia megaterium]|uniref:hypothetical protein n=1 Tax=Priestia megaterium TaxID=1404 RepID=UPI0025AF3A26|nr:hypothetical protein [Priestia megaterium]MDN3233550.1 hypothetical protein [Priestia megaterium]